MRRGWQPGPPPRPPQLQMWWWGPGAQRLDPRQFADLTAGTPGGQTPTAQTPAAQTPAVPATPVRIGDAERDRAVSDLGDHFAAGRLTREEFDERADQAMQARFSTDLEPLFADLPKPASAEPATEPVPAQAGGPPPWAYAMWLMPIVVIAAIAGSFLLHAPFVLGLLVWFVVMGRIAHYRRRVSRPGPR